jgi:hypothetical protein
MNYYLVLQRTLFIDPHGVADEGGTFIFVEETPLEIKTDSFYKQPVGHLTEEEYKEIFEDDDMVYDYLAIEEDYQGSEDGYNSQEEVLIYNKITVSDYHDYKTIISQYDSLRNKFDPDYFPEEEDEEDENQYQN